MIEHLVATALATVALAAGASPAQQTGDGVTHIGTALSIVGGQAPAKLEVGNALKVTGLAALTLARR